MQYHNSHSLPDCNILADKYKRLLVLIRNYKYIEWRGAIEKAWHFDSVQYESPCHQYEIDYRSCLFSKMGFDSVSYVIKRIANITVIGHTIY